MARKSPSIPIEKSPGLCPTFLAPLFLLCQPGLPLPAGGTHQFVGKGREREGGKLTAASSVRPLDVLSPSSERLKLIPGVSAAAAALESLRLGTRVGGWWRLWLLQLPQNRKVFHCPLQFASTDGRRGRREKKEEDKACFPFCCRAPHTNGTFSSSPSPPSGLGGRCCIFHSPHNRPRARAWPASSGWSMAAD